MARQVLGEYEVNGPLLEKYHDLVTHLWVNFEDVQLKQILREKNIRVDKLSKLDLSDLKACIRILVEYMG